MEDVTKAIFDQLMAAYDDILAEKNLKIEELRAELELMKDG